MFARAPSTARSRPSNTRYQGPLRYMIARKEVLACKAPACTSATLLQVSAVNPLAELEITPSWVQGKFLIVFGWQKSGTAAAELAALHGATVLGEFCCELSDFLAQHRA